MAQRTENATSESCQKKPLAELWKSLGEPDNRAFEDFCNAWGFWQVGTALATPWDALPALWHMLGNVSQMLGKCTLLPVRQPLPWQGSADIRCVGVFAPPDLAACGLTVGPERHEVKVGLPRGAHPDSCHAAASAVGPRACAHQGSGSGGAWHV